MNRIRRYLHTLARRWRMNRERMILHQAAGLLSNADCYTWCMITDEEQERALRVLYRALLGLTGDPLVWSLYRRMADRL